MPDIIGITGGIGSGKSLTAAQFKKLGVPVLDADAIVGELYEKSAALKEGLAAEFGEGALNGDGTVNRGYIAGRVFSDSQSLERLNALVHPLVKAELLRRSKAYDAVVWDVPLLFECGLEAFTAAVVVVLADRDRRILRVMGRSGLTKREIEDRMNAQLPDFCRMQRADYVCINNGSEAELEGEVKRIYDDFCKGRGL
ncbi:MAG: dephospho-CoA kinase [Clostridia bacterium]|nr:dephospho-CoA kinase [Clostridia bacterium]